VSRTLWKNIIATLAIVSNFALLVVGQIYWVHKIDKSVQNALTEQKEGSIGQIDMQQGNERKQQLIKYATNLPTRIQKKIGEAVDTGKPVQLVIVGSEAVSSSRDGWPQLLAEVLHSTYGMDILSIKVKEYRDMTTMEAVENQIYNEIIKLRPDILLLEPFILNNNGVIPIKRTLDDLTYILKEVQSAIPDVVVILQPAHPIYNARYYPIQVNQLKKYAEENNYIYLDHWTSWPNYMTSKIRNYLSEDQSVPNADGYRLWADFLIDYFVAK